MNKYILYLPIALLVIGVFALPVGYYTLVKLVVTAVAIFIAWKTYKQNKKSVWVWLFCLVSLLFNPLIPIDLNKITWALINLATAGLFLFYSKKIQ